MTKPATLEGIARDVDVVISAIGITRQKDGLRYQDVDYQGNLNLLKEAIRSGAKKFVYVSVLHADQMSDLQIIQAKERFVGELRNWGLDYAVIRPNGYFTDMLAFLNMAKGGQVFLSVEVTSESIQYLETMSLVDALMQLISMIEN